MYILLCGYPPFDYDQGKRSGIFLWVVFFWWRVWVFFLAGFLLMDFSRNL